MKDGYDEKGYPAPSKNNFPIWIVAVLLLVLCLCLGVAALIGVVVSNNEFQDSVSELFNEGSDVATVAPTVEVIETAVSTPSPSSTLSASAVKQTPAPSSSPLLTDMESLQAAIAPYTETNLAALPTVYGGETTAIKHDLDGFIKMVEAEVSVTDFVADALFYNPFAVSKNGWDIGYGFHRTDDGELWIIIDSDGEWELMNGAGDDGDLIDSGVINGRLNTNADEANRLTLIAQGKKGYFFVNNELAARLDLSSRTNSGDVVAATAFYTGHEVDGAVTKVENFTIWELDGE